MKFVEPKIYILAKSHLEDHDTRQWLHDLGTSNYVIPEQDPILALAGKRCYMSFEPGLNPNVTKVRKEVVAFIENILKSGHGSVLEHMTYTFAFENVSRVFTAEMNRHRAGWAVSEGSMRFIRYDDIPFWMPLSIQHEDGDSPELQIAKEESREVFCAAFRQMEENYKRLKEIWNIDSLKAFKEKKKITSMMRRIIGLGVATGGVWTGNIRAIRHVLSVRVDAAAEEEIAYVFTLVLKRMMEEEPILFKDFYQTEDGFWAPKYVKV